MIERCEDFGFTPKSREAFAVSGDRCRQDLDRDLPLQLQIDGAIHLAHAAGPDGVNDFRTVRCGYRDPAPKDSARIIGALKLLNRSHDPRYNQAVLESRMNVPFIVIITALVALAGASPGAAQEKTADLLAALRHGGNVIVMRHASSPREVPDEKAANPDNVKRERQLDEAGRTTSVAMGKAIRDLKISIGEVLTSPTYRAMETVRLAQLPNAKAVDELGDGGQSMQAVADAQAAWLRERVTHLPTGTNTIIVTHMPNIARAFPDWGMVADGEGVILGVDAKGGTRPVGRIKIEEWPRLR